MGGAVVRVAQEPGGLLELACLQPPLKTRAASFEGCHAMRDAFTGHHGTNYEHHRGSDGSAPPSLLRSAARHPAERHGTSQWSGAQVYNRS